MKNKKQFTGTLLILAASACLFLLLFMELISHRMTMQVYATFRFSPSWLFDYMMKWKKAVLFCAVTAFGYGAGELIWRRTGAKRIRMVWRLLAVAGLVYFGIPAGRDLLAEREADLQVQKIRTMLKENGRVVHAGGQLTGDDGEVYTVTNSVEAMENALANGERIIEIDVRPTSDKVLVCYHYYFDLFKEDGTALEQKEKITAADFAAMHTVGGYTPMTFEQVLGYMEEYPDLYIVLDVKKSWSKTMKMIAAASGDLKDRMIVQMVRRGHYKTARSLGFNTMIYTLYRAKEQDLEPQTLAAFLENNLLVGVTFEVERFDTNPELVELLKASGERLYTHTVDDENQIEEYLNMGLDAVYTNLVRDLN